MANTDKDILITPNRGSSNEPKIEFKGASSTVGPSTITATIYPTNNGTLSFDGTEGSLFSIANNLTTGSIFSVNPISGIPIIDVNADRTIALNPYGGNTGIGLTNPSYKLDVNGTARFSGQLTIPGNNSILFGPNSTWSRYLRIGGNGWAADSTTASVVTTDGNLHLDAADANHGIYLNWYGGTNGTFFGNGAAGQIGRLDGSGNFSVSGTITGTQITSNIANGTAPFVVSSTTKVTNLNADYLDDLDSGSFLRSDADDSASGIIDFLGGSGIYPAVRVRSGGNSWSEGVAIHPASDNGYALTFYRTRASLTDSTNNWAIGNSGSGGTNNFVLLRNGLTGSSANQPEAVFDVTQAGVFRFGFTPTVGSNTIWHAGNDGSGSGLDADLIDGLAFNNSNITNPVTAPDSLNSNGIGYVTNISLYGQTDGALYSQAYSPEWQHQIYGDYRTGQIAIRGKNSNTWQSWRTVWDSGNAGSPSDYKRSNDQNQVNINSPASSSGSWSTGSADEYGNPKFDGVYNEYRYANAPAWVQYNIPVGMKSAWISQLCWSDGGYVDVHGIQSGGQLVFLRRINTRQTVENTDEGVNHDGSTITFAASGLDDYSAIRFTVQSGRFHFTGLSFSTADNEGTEGVGMVHPAQISHQGSGSGLDADTVDGLNPTSANTASTIVARDGSGNFNAGTLGLTGINIDGANLNATNDATVYITATNNNDWGLVVNKFNSSAIEYGQEIRVASGADYAFSILGSGTRNFRINGAGSVFSNGTVTATYFRDTDDTNYYGDFANAGLSLNLRGSANIGKGFTTSGADIGASIYYGSDSSGYGRIRFYENDVNTQTIHAFSANWGSGFPAQSRGAININGANGVTMGGWNAINSTGHWFDNSGNGQSSASFRSPVFYDSDNTTYQFDGTGTTRLNTLRVFSNSGADWDAIQISTDGANGYIQGLGDETGLRIRSQYGNILLADDRGSVGIKNTSPLQALDVRGNFLLAADSTTATHITQKPYTINGGTLSWEGSAGQLFSITNNLTSGSIFSVNDVSGLPSIDVDANGTILFAPYGGNIGLGTLTPTQKLHVVGSSIISGTLGLGVDSAVAKLHTRVSTPTSIGSLPSGVTGILDSSSNNYLLFRNSADNGTYSGIAMQDNNVGGYVIFGNAGGGGDLLYLAGYGGGQLQYGTADSINPSARTTVASWNSTGLQINNGDLRAPLFYDSNDTAYYVDPTSTSNIRYLKINTTGTSSGTRALTIKADGQGEINFGAYPASWTSALQIQNNDNTDMVWISPIDDGYNARFRTGGCGLDFYTDGTTTDTGTFSAFIGSGSVRSPIFYDSNDTAYYVDPASTSNSALRIRGGALHGPNATWGSYLLVGGEGRTGYIDNTTTASVCSTNGNLHIDAASGYETYINYYDGNKIVFGNGSNGSWGEWSSGILYSYSNTRSPIFYDYNDTAYYLDLNSTGNSINIAGSLRAATYNKPAILSVANGSASTGASFAIQQETVEGWTGIFVDFEPYTGWGLYHDNPNNYFCITSEDSTGSLRSFTVPSRVSGNRTAYEKIRFDQNNGNLIAGGEIQGTIFKDHNDTSYFLNPATDSLLRAVTIRDGGLKLERAYANNSIWFAGGTDDNHVLWNDALGGPGARGGSGFDGMKWNTYRGIYFRTGYGGQYNSLEISGSGASNDHQVYLYGANDEKLRTVTTDGIQIQRDLYISGSTGGIYGNRLVVGNTGTSFTVQDGNLRPTIQAYGAYPVVSLNHTDTSNPSHGPTLQFTCNGTGNQFVIGTNGTGTFLSMGYSNAGDWNPHNGINGYNGTSFFHANSSGNIGLGAGGDWGSNGGGDPGYNLHFVGSNNATGGHAAFFDNRVSAVNGSGFLFRNQYGNHSWGIVAEYRVEGTGGTDRPSILFSTGYNSNTWSVGYGYTDDSFRINYDHGHRNSSWGTTAVLVDRSSIMTVSGEIRAPIFRDSNDPSNYYVDPTGTSRIYDIYIVGGVPGVSNSSMYHEAAIEVRERGKGGAQDDTWATAPRIGFHWGDRVASQIALASNGRISILNNPGNALENFQCNDAYVNSVNLPNGFQIQQGGSNYGVFNSWVRLDGTYGFYSSVNGAHFYVNDGTYGAWRINGSRDGWRGLNFDNSVVLMMNDNESGHHRNGYGWQFRWADGSLYCHKNGQGGGTSATVWDSVNASRAANSNLMYYQGFTLDANTMESNSTGFTYSVNAPYTGPIVRFSTGGGYDLWLNSPYNSNGYGLAFRTRNGDTASLNSWQYPAVYNVNSNGGGDLYSTRYYDSNDINYYVDPASTSILNSLTVNGSLNAYANPITVNRINFRSTSGSAQSDPYCLRWMDESSNGGLSWLELQLNDDWNEEFRIYGNSCSGYGCGEISGNLYHRFRADGYAWHSGNLEVGGNVTATNFYGNGSNLTGITAGATLSASSGSQRVVLTSLTSGTMTSAATSSALTFDSSTGTLSSTIFTSTSDITKKTNIQNIKNAVELTKQINGIKFDWKETGESSAGVIAQEVEEVLPEIVHTNDEGIKSVNYNGVVGLLVEAIKEQQKQIDELKKELKKLHK